MRADADDAAEEMSIRLAAEEDRARQAHDRLAEATAAQAAEIEPHPARQAQERSPPPRPNETMPSRPPRPPGTPR